LIVCVCNCLRESQCRHAADHPGVKRASSVYRHLGVKVRCGRCVATVQQIVDHAHAERAATEDSVALAPEAVPAE
jgi:bacterioferritin-associated ferredoxin